MEKTITFTPEQLEAQKIQKEKDFQTTLNALNLMSQQQEQIKKVKSAVINLRSKYGRENNELKTNKDIAFSNGVFTACVEILEALEVPKKS